MQEKQKDIKWFDPEDQQNYEEEDVANIHKKVVKKNKNLSQGLQQYLNNSLKNKNFLDWTKNTQQNLEINEDSVNQYLQQSEFYQTEQTYKINIKKQFQTDLKDSLRSVVQDVDTYEDNFIYGGFNKILKIGKKINDQKKNYVIDHSIYLESLPIQNCRYVNDNNKIILTFLKKKFINIFDINKQKSQSIYKLFKIPLMVEKICVNSDKNLSIITSKNQLSVFNNKTNLVEQKTTQQSHINDVTFLDDQRVAICMNNFQLKIFDLRKNLKIPLHQKRENGIIVSGCDKYLAMGQKNGIVKIFQTDQLKEIKQYTQLTTEITSLDITNNFLVFGSKWKKNNLRLVDLSQYTIQKDWPNVKTNLGMVSKLHLNDKDELYYGNSKGEIGNYNLYEKSNQFSSLRTYQLPV